MITDFFCTELSNINLKDMWVQQDHAKANYTNEIIQLLNETLMVEIFLEMVMLIGQQNHAIVHLWDILFKVM